MAFVDSIVPNGKAPPLFTPSPKKGAKAPKVPHFECRFVPADHRLSAQWPYVKAGLETLLSKIRPAGFYTFRPEDIYMALRAKQIVLYVVYLDGRLSGFGITRRAEDAFQNADPYLLAWLGWCDKREATDLYFRELEKMAAGLSLKEVRLYSTRKGWIMHPPNNDWELQTSGGWLPLKTADREVRKGLYQAFELVPEICMRRVV